MTSFLLTSLNLLLLYRGTLTIPPGYSISMPKKVLVEINHCTDVPCMFTTPERYSKSSAPFYIYWFKSIRKRYYLVWINMWVPGYLMVTNDLRQKAEITNFKLIGDPKNGDCSFSIANAQPVDSGKYYMRIDKGSGFRYAFESSAPQHHVNPQIVVRDSPQIKVIQVLKKQENVQVATILLGTFVSILILIACLYFFSG
ncbi:sialic acid-binding Ig-like lectin 14 isoform X4 [Pantherophis guttatus]|uniref:Sialic acid-binding Ig-like lectin 14 isoform X4 n=1 Tax=Pantherophis guttatus TaxID=94885 RepID=A0A6P9DET3_PANGU|nr:sialic acid-binding Ig-like lectin 14 isoform X4 [Pantherophis guttatus]